MIVTSAWLAQHLDDSNLVLLHVGTKGDLRRGTYPRRATGVGGRALDLRTVRERPRDAARR